MYERRFRGYMAEMYKIQGIPHGPEWAKLSEKYATWKGNETVGVLTGDMRASLTGGKGYYKRITDDSAAFGQRKGAAPHTKWFRDGRVKRPIELSEHEKNIWKDMAFQYYKNVLHNAMDPRARVKSIRLPNGDLMVVHKNGDVSVRSPIGQFQTKAAQNTAMARMVRRARGSG
jgi:hypothetical protein